MVLEGFSNSALPVWLTAAIFLTLLLGLSLSTASYQFIWYTSVVAAAVTIFFFVHDTILRLFIFLLLFRYVRLIVNQAAFCLYKPVAVPTKPTLTAKDVTVIVPTVEPYGEQFEECIRSIHVNEPAKIIIVAAGPGNYDRAINSMGMYSNVRVMHCTVQNKRQQICEALPEVDTDITVLCDDHVFWLTKFLPCVLAPFEDSAVGCVGTNKRVRRTISHFSFAAFWNVIGCLYLERHNFEIAATNTVDGGVFVVSGRTSAHRSAILQDEAFMTGFTNEYACFGLFGPLNADDDNFITRWMVEQGKKIKIQYSEDACIETTLGEYPKFLSQCMRWARTTWRSNPRSLASGRTWWTQPWCIYAVYLTSFVNFALFYDAALLLTLWFGLAKPGNDRFIGSTAGVLTLSLWIFGTKLVKPFPHFRRNPRDLVYLPGYILFGYFHSLIKLVALLTFWHTAWGSRSLSNEEQGLLTGDVAGISRDVATQTDTNEGLSDVVMEGMDGDAALDNDTTEGLSEVVIEQE